MAKKSIVLLKNDNALLPLKKEGQKIALIGALAADKTSPLGSWRIAAEDSTAISVLEGLEAYTANELLYAKGADLIKGTPDFIHEVKINETDKSGFKEAMQIARQAHVVVMVLGEHGFQSGEGRSRVNVGLPGVQQELLEAVYSVNKNIVLVLQNGRPLAINWAHEHVPAIVEAWHLGTQSGHAIAQVLYGDYNPSGKLPMSFPRHVGQLPIYYNYKNTGRPSMPAPDQVFWSHYTDEDNTPLYPFGFGLSYTNFTYKAIQVTNTFKKNKEVRISVDVTNTGNYEGTEIAQLYIRDLVAKITRPVKELKGFEKVTLLPGETKTIHFVLTEEDLGYYDNTGAFLIEPGKFKVFVGGSSNTQLDTAFIL